MEFLSHDVQSNDINYMCITNVNENFNRKDTYDAKSSIECAAINLSLIHI